MGCHHWRPIAGKKKKQKPKYMPARMLGAVGAVRVATPRHTSRATTTVAVGTVGAGAEWRTCTLLACRVPSIIHGPPRCRHFECRLS